MTRPAWYHKLGNPDTPYEEIWSPRSPINRFQKWVVVMRSDHRIVVVDGAQGAFGEEPVVAGPFKTIEDAQVAVEMLTAMSI